VDVTGAAASCACVVKALSALPNNASPGCPVCSSPHGMRRSFRQVTPRARPLHDRKRLVMTTFRASHGQL